jgi:hypothetical protein
MTDTTADIVKIVRDVSSEIKQVRIESEKSIDSLDSSMDKIERELSDMRTKTYELSGLIAAAGSDTIGRKRIVHNED